MDSRTDFDHYSFPILSARRGRRASLAAAPAIPEHKSSSEAKQPESEEAADLARLHNSADARMTDDSLTLETVIGLSDNPPQFQRATPI